MSNGYCTVHIEGKKIGVKFGLQALFMIDEKIKKMNKIPRVGSTFDLLTLAYYAYAGHYVNCLVKDVEEEFSFEQIYDYFEEHKNDEVLAEEIKNMMEVFSKSISSLTDKNKTEEPIGEKKNQKKSSGKKLKETVSSLD
jgi:hypothetical protein